MADGAHGGVRAGAAMAKIVGGREIADDQISSLNEARDRIMSTIPEMLDGAEGEDGYNISADLAARMVYEKFMEDPESAKLGEHQFYEKYMRGNDLGLSGFQWGWAFNLARALVELPPVNNPAIITIGEPNDDLPGED